MGEFVDSFYIRSSVINLKQEIEMNDGESIVAIKPKISLKNVKYYFYENGVLSYYGVLQNTKKVITHEFALYNFAGEELGVIQKTPIHKKKQLFEEFIVELKNEIYHIQSTAASKKIIVKGQRGDVFVEATRNSSMAKRLLGYNSYTVHIYKNPYESTLWVAIIKGVLELLS